MLLHVQPVWHALKNEKDYVSLVDQTAGYLNEKKILKIVYILDTYGPHVRMALKK